MDEEFHFVFRFNIGFRIEALTPRTTPAGSAQLLFPLLVNLVNCILYVYNCISQLFTWRYFFIFVFCSLSVRLFVSLCRNARIKKDILDQRNDFIFFPSLLLLYHYDNRLRFVKVKVKKNNILNNNCNP